MKPDVTTLGHRVEVVQSGEWWAITVPSLRGVFSQARHLDEVPAAACEAIALMLDVDPADVGPIDVCVQRQQGGAELLAG
ncbi:type II toxin-antitoxin system HicB family antitoxin [Candidatus Poriferisodalis sp.]|uniref:type II toxin-antitoxin system HicB family antitoxin n=1 Tax=Candidatus Poriferisodalis sp. TaxID=3101277 RepID=UPI003C6F23B1